MAKRGVIDHPKFARLKMRLRLNKSATLGYLETLWQFVGRYTPQGNVGKYTDAEIEAWLEWDGDEGALIEAFITCGWIDMDDVHRLVIHDWHDHVDNTTRIALKRAGLSPVISGDCHNTITKNSQKHEHCHNSVETESRFSSTVLAPPEPEPEPVPEPVPVPEGVQGENAITCSEPAEPSWFDQDVGDGGQTYEAGLVRQIRAARGYDGFDPPRDQWDSLLAWMRGFAPGDDAITSLVDSFCERADQRRSKTPEYRDPVRALRKWAGNSEAQWRAARRARERDGVFVKPTRPPEPADDAPTPGELRRLAEEFSRSQGVANAG